MTSRLLSAVAVAVTIVGVPLPGAHAQPAAVGEWPQWRGPERTGISRETGLLKSWPAGGPRLAWKATGVGEGYTAPAVVGGTLYGMGLRGAEGEVVWALEARTGKQLWSTRIAAGAHLSGRQGGDGPRGTPAVDGDRLYALGVSGDLVCLGIADGKLRWKKSLVSDLGGSIPNWGYSESPLVDGNQVVVAPGGEAGAVVALDKMTGALVWKAAVPGVREAIYTSAIPVTVEGQRQYVQMLSGGVVGLAAQDGRLLWRCPMPPTPGAICVTPVIRDNHVFLAFKQKSSLVRVKPGTTVAAAELVYDTPKIQNQHGGVIPLGDLLYAFSGRSLVCMNPVTGDIVWEASSVGPGSVAYADGLLYARGERGEVALIEISPKGAVEKGRFLQPDRTREPAWSHPIVAGGRLYLRDQDTLYCYDVKAGAGT